MPKRTKRGWLDNPKLRASISDKRQRIVLERFPQELGGTLNRRTAVALKALHGFRKKRVQWGQNKKGGAVNMLFE
ncbi:MAG: hypothetical protein NTW59_01320, partial [Candidatus Diapherotrites archaeon]|nr:hypothetical protein [Candidatus Diapherotrites archaeon]